MKRIPELIVAFIALVVLFPLFLAITLVILLDSGTPVLYRQRRVGLNDRDFSIYKFRTMHRGAERQSLLTTGKADARVTRSGRFLRHYKLDELPQLFNILRGDMNFVGPRPEVRKYVARYTPEQQRVLTVRPGLTDYASLEYLHEGEILASSEDPEKRYVTEIMPAKLLLNLKYIDDRSPLKDIRIILRTLGSILRG
jgi:lipopolysaccharide/colanic/teichoic acid biosynthesis glycosyltransferase